MDKLKLSHLNPLVSKNSLKKQQVDKWICKRLWNASSHLLRAVQLQALKVWYRFVFALLNAWIRNSTLFFAHTFINITKVNRLGM